MKKVLLTLGVVALATSVLAQGTITFTTFSTANNVNAKAFLVSGPGLPLGTVALTGGGYFAQLLAAPGQDNAAGLLPALGITTFRTGSAAGYVALTTATASNVPKDHIPGATVQMVAWDNSSGLYPTWNEARTAWQNGLIAGGVSPLLNVTARIGGDIASPPFLSGLQSFNVYPIPEPSTFALAGLGAAALMIFRRRK